MHFFFLSWKIIAYYHSNSHCFEHFSYFVKEISTGIQKKFSIGFHTINQKATQNICLVPVHYFCNFIYQLSKSNYIILTIQALTVQQTNGCKRGNFPMLFINQICLNHGFKGIKSKIEIVKVDSIFTLKCKTTTGKWGNLTQITLTSLLGVNFPNIWIPRLQIYQMQLKGNKACLLDSNATKLSKEFCTKLDDSFN